MSDPTDLVAAATSLGATVAAARLPLPLASATHARAVQDELSGQFRDHLLPRLRDRGAPLLVVVGGSTGAGKSTLVNTLVGAVVSRTGVLRPTTRSPVLVHHPIDTGAFRSDRILPTMRRAVAADDPGAGPPARSSAASAGEPVDVVTLVATPEVGPGIGILDTPDIDSVAAANRALSRQLLAAADLWLFVTTPARYADAVPWDLLRAAAERGTSVAVVLDRIGAADRDEVVAHLRTMLDEGGLTRASLLVVEDVAVSDEQVPRPAIAEVVGFLDEVAGDESARRAVADATLTGALASVRDRVEVVLEAVGDQQEAVDQLRGRAAAAHEQAIETVLDALDDGRVLRGEVLARWHDFVGAGDLLRWLEGGVGRIRDRLSALVRTRSHPEEPLTDAVGDGLTAVIVDALQRARRDTIRSWQSAAGTDLVDDMALAAPPGLAGEARSLVQGWQDEVVELVRTQSADKRSSARLVALGLNGAAAAVMVAVFASTAGLTGAEVGVAAGTSIVAQRLLEAVLGDQAVRTMTTQARDALVRRVRRLVDDQAGEFLGRLDALGLDPQLPERLAADVVELDVARRDASL